jgi:serine/threonine protein kinase
MPLIQQKHEYLVRPYLKPLRPAAELLASLHGVLAMVELRPGRPASTQALQEAEETLRELLQVLGLRAAVPPGTHQQTRALCALLREVGTVSPPLQRGSTALQVTMNLRDGRLVAQLQQRLRAPVESALALDGVALDELSLHSFNPTVRDLAAELLGRAERDAGGAPKTFSMGVAAAKAPVAIKPQPDAPVRPTAAKKSRSLDAFHLVDPAAAQAVKKLRSSQLTGSDGRTFTLSSCRGNGTYGKFRLAIGDGEVFAVKEMRRYDTDRRRAKAPWGTKEATFAKEYQAMSVAHGPEMVKGWYQTEKSNFMFMKLMDDDLAHLAHKTGALNSRFTTADLLQLFHQATQQLSAQLHSYQQKSQNIICDIKPDNILVDRHGNFKLIDFGLIKAIDPITGRTVSSSAGTPGYTAPEAYGRGTAGFNADVWSLHKSILEIFINKARTPLQQVFADSEITYAEQDKLALLDYCEWHELQPRKHNGTLNLQALTPPNEPLTKYFKSLAAVNETLCQTTLDSLLQPDPQLRWSTQYYAKWAEEQGSQHLAEGPTPTILQEHAEHSVHHGDILEALRRHQKEHCSTGVSMVSAWKTLLTGG